MEPRSDSIFHTLSFGASIRTLAQRPPAAIRLRGDAALGGYVDHLPELTVFDAVQAETTCVGPVVQALRISAAALKSRARRP